MEITTISIITLVTTIITYIFGIISKKTGIVESQYVPIQNLIIGIVSGIISYALQIDGMDLTTSLITCLIASLGAGGAYDVLKTPKK